MELNGSNKEKKLNRKKEVKERFMKTNGEIDIRNR